MLQLANRKSEEKWKINHIPTQTKHQRCRGHVRLLWEMDKMWTLGDVGGQPGGDDVSEADEATMPR